MQNQVVSNALTRPEIVKNRINGGSTLGTRKPDISVCIPTYNRAPLLMLAIESVLREFAHQNSEIIVSDNASGDQTPELVQLLAQQSGNIKYYRNKTNIGLDDNVVRCIELARADYVFLFSDDDVLLPGAGACILDAIRRHSPAFVYVNHAGFLEDEDPDAVFRRGSSPDKPDVVYENGFLLIRDALLEHNSAMVFRRDEVIKHLDRLQDYRTGGFCRGYAPPVLAHNVVLSSRSTYVLIGKCCVAVRNLLKPTYNPLYTGHIDIVRHYHALQRRGLLTPNQLRALMKRRIWRVRKNMILTMKCSGDPRLTQKEIDWFFRLDSGYWQFYVYLLPILVLPRFVLCPLYWVARKTAHALDRL